jgi:hypothetical protein
VRIIDSHGETVFKKEQAENLPCCQDGPCEQHITEELLKRGVFYEGGRKYRLARERAAVRLKGNGASRG